MCDWYSDTHGYLCNECRGELLYKLHIWNSIYEFMSTPKTEVDDHTILSYNDVIEEFKER